MPPRSHERSSTVLKKGHFGDLVTLTTTIVLVGGKFCVVPPLQHRSVGCRKLLPHGNGTHGKVGSLEDLADPGRVRTAVQRIYRGPYVTAARNDEETASAARPAKIPTHEQAHVSNASQKKKKEKEKRQDQTWNSNPTQSTTLRTDLKLEPPFEFHSPAKASKSGGQTRKTPQIARETQRNNRKLPGQLSELPNTNPLIAGHGGGGGGGGGGGAGGINGAGGGNNGGGNGGGGPGRGGRGGRGFGRGGPRGGGYGRGGGGGFGRGGGGGGRGGRGGGYGYGRGY
ncbi:hypothetical protein GGX14DRAFT_390819 [Mycena pura]|uniref:Uncharacterized protein n=1 Tax=Mycena pura TaxID=153505 RepID=A0AAD6VQG5_9AGAR|nr:hypothetical protein GGX14DRAFT_390819 [Mycena pura]